MLEPELGDDLRQKIWDNKTYTNVSYYADSFSNADYGTTHVAVLDQYGDAVSVTSTINMRLVDLKSPVGITDCTSEPWVHHNWGPGTGSFSWFLLRRQEPQETAALVGFENS